MQALASGEEAEFTALVQRQWRFVFRVAYAVLQNSHDAEDAVQETFLKLYRNRSWRNVEKERAFLARVAWRVAIDRQRAPSPPIEAITPASADSGVLLDPPSPEPNPEQMLTMTDQHAAIHAMIDALPEELRVPLVLSAFEELNSREIGGVLSIPEGTVRTRLQRAREVLRRKLSALDRAHTPEARHAR